jgi:hypothetical protein
MQTTVRRLSKSWKYLPVAKGCSKGRQNGHVDVVSPSTASEIRKTLGIGAAQIRKVRRALQTAGVKI